jgi:hypothetical protein
MVLRTRIPGFSFFAVAFLLFLASCSGPSYLSNEAVFTIKCHITRDLVEELGKKQLVSFRQDIFVWTIDLKRFIYFVWDTNAAYQIDKADHNELCMIYGDRNGWEIMHCVNRYVGSYSEYFIDPTPLNRTNKTALMRTGICEKIPLRAMPAKRF